jgi:hypothetical protein
MPLGSCSGMEIIWRQTLTTGKMPMSDSPQVRHLPFPIRHSLSSRDDRWSRSFHGWWIFCTHSRSEAIVRSFFERLPGQDRYPPEWFRSCAGLIHPLSLMLKGVNFFTLRGEFGCPVGGHGTSSYRIGKRP